ncbi:unnamed protein product [Natator depressus]
MTTEDLTVYLLPAGRIIHFCIHFYEEAHCRLNETSQASFKQSLKMTLSSIYIYIQQQVISCQWTKSLPCYRWAHWKGQWCRSYLIRDDGTILLLQGRMAQGMKFLCSIMD